MIGKLLLVPLLVLLMFGGEARAQAVVTICVQSTPGPSCTPVTVTNPLPVNAVATVGGGFTAASTGTPIAVTTSNSTGTLPAGSVVIATNVGATNAAYCALGAAATTSSQYLSPGGGWFAFTVGSATQLTCVTSSSTTTVNMTGGTGLPTGTGGGGGGGGGGGSVTQGTTPWVVAGNGVAGTAAAGVLSIQGIASMTPVLTSSSGGALMLDATGQSIITAIQGDVPSVTGPLNAGAAVATKSLMVGAQYLSSAPTMTNTQQGALLADVNGNLKVNVITATGLADGSTSVGQTFSKVGANVTTANPTYTTGQTNPLSMDTSGNLRVTATIAANSSVNVAQINGVTPLMGNGVTGTGSPRVTIVSDGTAISTTGYMSVKLDQTTPGTTNAVSIAQIAGTTILNGGVAGSQSIGGTVATNVAINSNPVNLGVQAVSSENAAVTTARQVQLVADLVGKLIVLPYSNPENFVSGVITSAMTGTTTTSLIASPGGSLRNYITQITCYNTHATVGTDILVQDGSGGTTIYLVPAAIAYGGAVINFPTPLRQPTTATAIFVANVTTGASTKCAASGYKGL